MRVLAIETSMGSTSVAVCQGGHALPLAVKSLGHGHGQAERLLPLIGELMAEAAIPFTSLDRVAVCTGPGGFSGIRTGVAAARGIGLAADVPVVGTTSFRIMATAFEKNFVAPDTYGLVAPAGLNAIFCQILKRGGEPSTGICLLPNAEVAKFLDGQALALVGPAAAALHEHGHVKLPVIASTLAPDAVTLCFIAPALDPDVDVPSPYYVRPPDAKAQTGHVIPRKSD